MKIRTKSETLVGPLVGDVIHEDAKEPVQLTDDAVVDDTSDDILKLGAREEPLVARPPGFPTDAPERSIQITAGNYFYCLLERVGEIMVVNLAKNRSVGLIEAVDFKNRD